MAPARWQNIRAGEVIAEFPFGLRSVNRAGTGAWAGIPMMKASGGFGWKAADARASASLVDGQVDQPLQRGARFIVALDVRKGDPRPRTTTNPGKWPGGKMLTTQNQTDPAELANVNPASTPGSGIFAIPDPNTVPDPVVDPFGAIAKVVVSPLTYDDCIRRGFFCIAFKWVPRSLNPTQTACPTPGAPCVSHCAARDLCLCVGGRCK
jgi:hypothetical protein